jgi:hypothetical protein
VTASGLRWVSERYHRERGARHKTLTDWAAPAPATGGGGVARDASAAVVAGIARLRVQF